MSSGHLLEISLFFSLYAFSVIKCLLIGPGWVALLSWVHLGPSGPASTLPASLLVIRGHVSHTVSGSHASQPHLSLGHPTSPERPTGMWGKGRAQAVGLMKVPSIPASVSLPALRPGWHFPVHSQQTFCLELRAPSLPHGACLVCLTQGMNPPSWSMLS